MAQALPSDAETLKALLLKERAEHAAALAAKDRADAENARLPEIIKALQRHRFGRRASAGPGLGGRRAGARRRRGRDGSYSAGRQDRARGQAASGSLPAHLPRIETVVDIEDKTCPGCRGALHRIGEDVAERLDIVPAQLRVLVVRRPKYACRACEDGVVQAPAPARLIEGGLPTEATVAHIVVAKYADHLPLYVRVW